MKDFTPVKNPHRGYAHLVIRTGAFVLLSLFGGSHCRKADDETKSGSKPDIEQKPTKVVAPEAPWFTDITEACGVRFQYENGATGKKFSPEIMGFGTALFDYDGDGDLDIYFVNGHKGFPASKRDSSSRNRLYRQEPDGRFVDVTNDSGLGDEGYGMGVAVGDFDNDGHPDVYITNHGPNQLYRNLGNGDFENITSKAGVGVDGWSASACFIDYNMDGFLDLFVTQYLKWNERKKCVSPAGRLTYCGPLAFPSLRNVLLKNQGDGTFVDVTSQAMPGAPEAASLGVLCEDLNGDRRPDIYVTNDAFANELWINQGDGTLRNEAVELGAAFNMYGSPEAGMGVVAGDFDGDLDLDLFMTHLTQETNTFYRNLGGELGYSDATALVGLGQSSLSFTGFGTAAFDIELDGDLDLVVLNGRVKSAEVLPDAAVDPPWDELAEPNLFYLNDGTGRLALVGQPAATLTSPVEISRGLAVGDLDGDGDIDLVMTNIQGPSRVYRNDAPRKGAWLVIRAFDPELKRDAIGARVLVAAGARRWVRSVTRAVSYMSSSDPRVYFGLGDVSVIDFIEVDWPGGPRERFPSAAVNTYVQVVRGTGIGK